MLVESGNSVDPVLVYQLGQAIDQLTKRPGHVTIENIKRLAELYGFDTFTEQLDPKIERLTIAGVILLIDIDFTYGGSGETDGGSVVYDEYKQRSDKVVTNVSLSLASDQKSKEGFDNGSSSGNKQHPEESSLINRLSLLKVAQMLKSRYSFTDNDINTSCSPNTILVSSLRPPKKAVWTGQIEYDVVKLNAFLENLRYLAKLDRLSVYSVNGAKELGKDSSSSNYDDHSDDCVDLFNYLNEFSLVLTALNAAQSKVKLANASKDAQLFERVMDILNGYLEFGQAVCNVGSELGVFVKYWEDNRILRYKKMYAEYMKDDIPVNGDYFDILNSIAETHEAQDIVSRKDAKYIKLGVDYHFKNGLIQIEDVVKSSYFKNSIKSAAMQRFDHATLAPTLANIDFLANFRLTSGMLSTFKNPKAKACLSLQLRPAVWMPTDLLGKHFQSFATYCEETLEEDECSDEEPNDMDDLMFRNKKRNNIHELYIKHYKDLFLEDVRHGPKRLKTPTINQVLRNLGQTEKARYLIKFDANAVHSGTQHGVYKAQIQINCRLVSKLRKIKSINLYNDFVEKISGIPVQSQGPNSMKEQLHADDVESTSHRAKKISDTWAPVLTSTRATFFKTDSTGSKSTMSVVSAVNSPSKQEPLDFLQSIRLFLENLRSLHLIWNLIQSLSKKSVVLTPEYEHHIHLDIKDIISDTTPAIIDKDSRPVRRDSRRLSVRRNSFKTSTGNINQPANSNIQIQLDDLVSSLYEENDSQSSLPANLASETIANKHSISSIKRRLSVSMHQQQQQNQKQTNNEPLNGQTNANTRSSSEPLLSCLNISLSSVPASSNIAQLIFSRINDTLDIPNDSTANAFDIYEIQLSTTLPIFKFVNINSDPAKSAFQINSDDMKNLRFFIHNGKIASIELLIEDKLCISTLDTDDADLHQNFRLVLKKLVHIVNSTEDLYYLLCSLLR